MASRSPGLCLVGASEGPGPQRVVVSPKQPRFNKLSAGAPGKKPVTKPVWLLLGLAAELLAAMRRKAYGCLSPR
jgi:hypothetical protein